MSARADGAEKEFASLRAALEEAQRAVELKHKEREKAQKLMGVEREGREEAGNSIRELQAKLASKKEELYAAFHQHEAMKNQVSELEKGAKDLKDSMPSIEV